MKIYIEKENKIIEKNFSKSLTVNQLLKLLKLNPQTVLVAKNKELVAEDEKLSDSDEIKILSVISGG